MTRVRSAATTTTGNRRATYADDFRRVRWRWLFSTASVWLLCGLMGCFFLAYLNGGVHGVDSHAYWATGHRANLYGASPGSRDAYLYSPAFAYLIWPLTQVPWHAFLAFWSAAETLTFGWLLAPLGWRWGVPMFCLCLVEVTVGNIYAFLAAVAVLGFRYPGVWALALLTKITPGLGPIWFATRRQWRAFWIAVGATAAIVAVSFGLSPTSWSEWIRFLVDHKSDQWFLPERIAAATALTISSARWNRAWLLPFAMLLTAPVVAHSWMSLTVLAAIPRLRASRPSERAAASDTIGA